MDPQKSGVEIPPPISSESHLEQLFYSHSNGSGDDKGVVEFEYVGGLERERAREEKKREKDWQGKCHRSSAVQSAVTRLVRHYLLSRFDRIGFVIDRRVSWFTGIDLDFDDGNFEFLDYGLVGFILG